MRFVLLSHVWCIYFRRFWVNKSSMRKIICSTVLPQNQDKVIHTWCTTFTLYSLFLHFKEEDRRIQTKLIMMARWTAASTSIQTWLLVFHFLHPKHEKCKVLFSTAVLTFWSTLMRWYLNLWEGFSHYIGSNKRINCPHNTDVRYLVMLTVDRSLISPCSSLLAWERRGLWESFTHWYYLLLYRYFRSVSAPSSFLKQ